MLKPSMLSITEQGRIYQGTIQLQFQGSFFAKVLFYALENAF